MTKNVPKKNYFHSLLGLSRSVMRDLDGFLHFLEEELPESFPNFSEAISFRKEIFQTELLSRPRLEDVIQYRHFLIHSHLLAEEVLNRVRTLPESEPKEYLKDVLGGILAGSSFLVEAIDRLLEWNRESNAAFQGN